MRINEEEYYTLDKVCVSGTAEFRRRKDLLFKYYYFFKRQTKDKLEYLMSKSYILGSGFSIEEKIKACIDISKQLDEFHSYGMCFNDIQSGNLLIDKNGGHLIDFDCSSFFGSADNSCKYKLGDALGNIYLSSIEVDLYKALICYLSLFYNIDLFKEIFYCSDRNIFNLPLLFYDTSIFLLLNRATNIVSTNDDVPFPDIKEFIPFILDEERFGYDLNKIKEKIKLLR